MDHLQNIVAKLRSPEGCPWDKEQTHQSIRNLLLEECYEVLEAIDSSDDSHLREELGDVLLHVVFHAQLARERDAFSLNDVADAVCEKLIRRHPHVFGDATCKDSEDVLRSWEKLKRAEKPQRKGALDGVPKILPALMRAKELQKKAAKSGFDWDDPKGVVHKTREELDELAEALETGTRGEVGEELGDLFFCLVNLARHLDFDAEQLCQATNEKFLARYRYMESALAEKGSSPKEASLEEMESYWQEAKQLLPKP